MGWNTKSTTLKHYAIYGKQLSVNGKWIQKLLNGEANDGIKELNGKKAVLFSHVVLEEFIEEDYRHGSSQLVENNTRGIRTFSSGEKRKALLEYLLKQQPEFLVLDSPFDSLDRESVIDLQKRLSELSKNIPVVQIFKRSEDLLPFISEVLHIENEKILASYKSSEFKAPELPGKSNLFKTIPASPVKYEHIPEVLVELKKVSVNYENRKILTDVSWKVKKGEFWQLAGPNGSGKTTLLSMIYGDNPKAYGQDLFLFGNRKGSGESVWEIKRKIGYFSPAATELFTGIHTAEQMLISGLVDSIGLYQEPSAGQITVAGEWLKTLDLVEERETPFRKLPLLQQRMLLIARSMIKHPPLLILDEPSASLDEESALVLTNLINIISEESETAIIYVSHRHEKGLKPNFILQLSPSEKGSTAERFRNDKAPI